MYFQIKKVILWPKNSELPPREVEFKIGKVNLLTGASKTGKSSIIPIIHYCLGTSKCSIPVKTIRDKTSWFGIVIQLENEQLLLARREPGSQKSTSDMFVTTGEDIDIPQEAPEKNSTVEKVKNLLNEKAGITNMPLDIENKDDFNGRPSIGDLLAFNFQPQNIIANSNTLYYRTDTVEYRKRLSKVFSFALGALTSEALVAKAKIETLEKVRKQLLKEQEVIVKRELSSLADMRTFILRAQELNILPVSSVGDLTGQQCHDLLSKTLKYQADSIGAQDDFKQQQVQIKWLEQKRTDLINTRNMKKRRVDALQRLNKSASSYSLELGVQKDRLELSKWLSDFIRHKNPEATNEELSKLTSALEEKESEFAALSRDVLSSSYDKEQLGYETDIDDLNKEIKGIESQVHAIRSSREEIDFLLRTNEKVQRFIGQVEQFLKTLQDDYDNDIADKLKDVNDKIKAQKEIYIESEVKERTKAALKTVSGYVTEYAKLTDAEDPDSPVELDTEELTIKVTYKDRENYLWELGSGANWLAYHIATTLGLHKRFIEQDISYVPSFIIYDQPSQVYFPSSEYAGILDSEEDVKNIREKLSSERSAEDDIKAVRKTFNSICRAAEQAKGNLQVIVLDHADLGIINNDDYLEVVDKPWRDGEALIPREWFDNK